MSNERQIVSVNDIKYIITNTEDCIQKVLVENVQWNNEMLLLIQELIKKHNLKHFLNIGSHIGTISMPISRVINKVTAIEAFYPTFCHLKSNIILNNITNIETHNIAIGDRRETIHFTTNDDRWTNNSGGMRVITELDKQLNIRHSDRSSNEISCQMYPLDQVSEIDNFDIVLVDIEGLEDRFLRGAKNKIIKNKPIIIIEIWDDEIRKDEKMFSSRQDIIDVITSLGYTLYKIIDDVDYVFLPNVTKNIPKKTIKDNFLMAFT
jgi:FkbM family methyltransferase